MNTDLMFSFKTVEWETPLWLFQELDKIHNFTLDVCAKYMNDEYDAKK